MLINTNKTYLGDFQVKVDAAVATLAAERVIPRLWQHDHTVWDPAPTEIVNRLGWLTIMRAMLMNVPNIQALADAVRSAGYTHALLLGMGGSSLATDVFRRTFDTTAGYLEVNILDSTAPGAVAAYADTLDLSHTLFIVATKSGGTAETLSAFKFFYNKLLDSMDKVEVGKHFVAITDPGSKLMLLAAHLGFRQTFLNDPQIGGRFAVLSYFGMLSVELMGLDVPLMLARAAAMADACGCDVPIAQNPGAWLGAVMGVLALAGRDKITFIASPAIASFGDWVEQLIAESTGKQGRGILPVVGERVGSPAVYGADRLFVYLRLANDGEHDAAVAALAAVGHPVVQLDLTDRYDLGGQFFLWEMATVIAGHLLGIQPFDQPDVEAAKKMARKFITVYQAAGKLPEITPAAPTAATLRNFVAQAARGDYIAIHAYVTPTAETDAALLKLRMALRDTTRLAVTTGYGPRFLHSTGQLHKGDAGKGLFVQLIAKAETDLSIPDTAGDAASSISFDVLKRAQALGDYEALVAVDRRVLRLQLGTDVAGDIAALSG